VAHLVTCLFLCYFVLAAEIQANKRTAQFLCIHEYTTCGVCIITMHALMLADHQHMINILNTSGDPPLPAALITAAVKSGPAKVVVISDAKHVSAASFCESARNWLEALQCGKHPPSA
jgi:hypothetical protein